MVSGFPGSGAFAQGFTLPANLDLALGQFREERTSGPFANQLVDVGDHVNGNGYVGGSAQILWDT